MNFLKRSMMFAAIFLCLFIYPAFNAELLFSTNSDYPTAILLGFLTYFLWQLFEKENFRNEAIIFSLLAIIFVQLRQANGYLLAIVIMAFALAYLPRIPKRLHSIMLSLILPCTILLIWNMYAVRFDNDMGFKIAGHFRFDLALPLLKAMGEEILKKSGYFLCLAIPLVWGCVSLLKPKTPSASLMWAMALLILGYFSFLLLAYLGSNFSEDELRRAASFYRYMMHLNLAVFLAVFFAIYPALQKMLETNSRHIALAGWFCLIAVPVSGYVFANSHLFPLPKPFITQTAMFADKIMDQLPKSAKIGVLLPEEDGLHPHVIRYNWVKNGEYGIKTPVISGWLNRYDYARNPQLLETFLSNYDVLLIAPNNKTAWQALNKPVENNWAAFEKNKEDWSRIAIPSSQRDTTN